MQPHRLYDYLVQAPLAGSEWAYGRRQGHPTAISGNPYLRRPGPE